MDREQSSAALWRSVDKRLDHLKGMFISFERQQRLARKGGLRPRDVLVRAATAELLREKLIGNTLENVDDAVTRLYGDCEATHWYTKAAVSPAATTVSGWALELVGQ